jgi:Uncharacterized protein conserved in bacteria (DUF2252)
MKEAPMTDLPPIVTAAIGYEDWLRRQVDVVEADLHLKHRQMASSPFIFLRATFYRWGPLWRETCPDLVQTPRVLAVGDLHVENFGTWRDKEGRLVWGVNDFDEVARMPYAVDLVRLVTSAILAQNENRPSSFLVKARCPAQRRTPQTYSAAAAQVPSRASREHNLLAPYRRGRELGPTALRRNRLQQWWFRRSRGESVVAVSMGLGQGTAEGACIFSEPT